MTLTARQPVLTSVNRALLATDWTLLTVFVLRTNALASTVKHQISVPHITEIIVQHVTLDLFLNPVNAELFNASVPTVLFLRTVFTMELSRVTLVTAALR
jgi:hypothetical protein